MGTVVLRRVFLDVPKSPLPGNKLNLTRETKERTRVILHFNGKLMEHEM